MNKDLNKKINIEEGLDKEKNKEFLDNSNVDNINFSNLSTKETAEISTETEESLLGNKAYKKISTNEEVKIRIKSKEIDKDNMIKIKKKKKGNKKNVKIENYLSEYPSKNNNININAPKLPMNYDKTFNMDKMTNQKNIGNKDYLTNTINNKYNNNEFKKISVISHDKLLHLITNENIYNKKTEKENYNKVSITERFKHKFLTTIYLFPKK
jgi:hypothetical protein